jgi:sec-independent protein translocase protein TatA
VVDQPIRIIRIGGQIMFGLGISEMIIIAAIILLIFGARRLPEIGEGIGKTVKEIKRVSKDLKKGGKEKADTSDEEKPENQEQHNASRLLNLRDEIENVPGVREIKGVQETASEVRKWWRFLKH